MGKIDNDIQIISLDTEAGTKLSIKTYSTCVIPLHSINSIVLRYCHRGTVMSKKRATE